ncbi:MAG: 16S rRNA methyltransferase [Promethearchaeota archaeon]
MSLTIILVDCGLEIIPKQIRRNPSISRSISQKNYSSQLLDNALHHSAMKNLKNFEKRGRPDITHLCLLNALGSPLNKLEKLKLYIHTIHNKIFEINPDIRIAYNRFKGLMAKLLIEERIATEDSILISSVNENLQNLINKVKNSEILLFSHKGRLIKTYRDLFSEKSNKNYVAVIGGFQKSTFSKEILQLSENLISLSEYSLDAWIIVSKIINYYEIIHE